MEEFRSVTRLAWAVIGAAVIVVLVSTPGYAVDPDVVITGYSDRCVATPPEVVIERGGAVCFRNEVERTDIIIRFSEGVLFGPPPPVDEIPVPYETIRCVSRDPDALTSEIFYDVFVGDTQCSDPGPDRPKIIINPRQ